MKKSKSFLIRVFYANTIFFLFNVFLFLAFPKFDIYFSELFFLNGEFLDQHFHVIKLLRNFLKDILIIIPLLSLTLLVVIIINKSQKVLINNNKSLRRFKLFLCGLIFGPIVGCGIIANLYFKDTWGRARPVHIEEFGGSKLFTAAMIKSDQCEKNCSWIGGETSAAFSLLTGTLILKRAYIILAINFLLGALVTFCRLAMGGHFLSDNLFAINFMIFLALLYRIISLWCVKEKLITK